MHVNAFVKILPSNFVQLVLIIVFLSCLVLLIQMEHSDFIEKKVIKLEQKDLL